MMHKRNANVLPMTSDEMEEDTKGVVTSTLLPKRGKKKRMMTGEAWAANISKKLEKKGMFDLFKDDSEKMKDSRCRCIYTRWGKITFVVATFVVLYVFLRVTYPHAQRAYDSNRDKIRSHIDPYTDHATNHKYVENFIYWVDGTASNAQTEAKEYFTEQRPQVLASARDFQIHPYFMKVMLEDGFLETDMSLYSMMSLRTRKMNDLKVSRDDFRVSFDRCEMVRFFERNEIPTPKLGKIWQGKDEKQDLVRIFTKDETGNDARELLEKTTAAILRSCHKFDGELFKTVDVNVREGEFHHSSIRPIDLTSSSKDFTAPTRYQTNRWIEREWNAVSNDYTHTWSGASNEMSNTVRPGMYFQSRVGCEANTESLSCDPNSYLVLSIEVLWGSPYLATEELEDKHIIYLRDMPHVQESDANWSPRVEVYQGRYSKTVHSPTAKELPQESHGWLTKRHLDCAWNLAQQTSKKVRAGQVRVDIFVPRDRPQNCLVESVILSDPAFHAVHSRHIANLWGMPYLEDLYVGASEIKSGERTFDLTGIPSVYF